MTPDFDRAAALAEALRETGATQDQIDALLLDEHDTD